MATNRRPLTAASKSTRTAATKPPIAVAKRPPTAADRARAAPWLAGLNAAELAELDQAVAQAREQAWGKARAASDPLLAWASANPEAFREAMQPRPSLVADDSPEHQRRRKSIAARGGIVGRKTATRAALRTFETWHLRSLLSAFEPRDPTLRGKALATLPGVEPAVQRVAEWRNVRRAAGIISDCARRKMDPVGADADAAAQRLVASCLDDAAALVARAEDSVAEMQELVADDGTTRRRASVELLHAALDKSPATVARLLVESLSWRSPPCPKFLRARGVVAANDARPESIVDLIKGDLKRLPWEEPWRRVRAMHKRYLTLAESRGHLAQGEARQRLAAFDERHERESARLRDLTDAEAMAEAIAFAPQAKKEMDELTRRIRAARG